MCKSNRRSRKLLSLNPIVQISSSLLSVSSLSEPSSLSICRSTLQTRISLHLLHNPIYYTIKHVWYAASTPVQLSHTPMLTPPSQTTPTSKRRPPRTSPAAKTRAWAWPTSSPVPSRTPSTRPSAATTRSQRARMPNRTTPRARASLAALFRARTTRIYPVKS